MQLVDALARLLGAISSNGDIDAVDGVFGPDDGSVNSLVTSMVSNARAVGATIRQPLSGSLEADIAQAGDALRLTANLTRQYLALKKEGPSILGSIIAAANNAWEETDNVGEPALVAHALCASILVLAYVELGKKGKKTDVRPAKEKIVPETVAALRSGFERLRAWSPTRFSNISTKTFWNIPGNGEIAAIQYFYTFEGARYFETDMGELDQGASQRIAERRRLHIDATWAEIASALQPASHAADVLERWAASR